MDPPATWAPGPGQGHRQRGLVVSVGEPASAPASSASGRVGGRVAPVRDRQAEAVAIARRHGTEVVVACSPAAVTWLTGMAPRIGTGLAPWAAPPVAVVGVDLPATLLAAPEQLPAEPPADVELVRILGYHLGSLDPMAALVAALEPLVSGRRVAGELDALPARIAAPLAAVDIGAALAWARRLKAVDELALIRAAVRLCDVGQAELRAQARPGRTELEIWASVRAQMEHAAGHPLVVLADVVSAPSAQRFEGPAGPEVLRPSTAVLADLAPRLDGYWGDSCATVAIGTASRELRACHGRVRDRLHAAVERVRPGLQAGALDQLLRRGLDFPHHAGHGLGTTYHDAPRIVPEGRDRLEAGMVLALEPADYGAEVGVRLEWVVHVTADGCEILSTHDLGL